MSKQVKDIKGSPCGSRLTTPRSYTHKTTLKFKALFCKRDSAFFMFYILLALRECLYRDKIVYIRREDKSQQGYTLNRYCGIHTKRDGGTKERAVGYGCR